jgi:heptosyltransferase-3
MAQTITALQQDGHTARSPGPDKKELAMIDRILAASPKTESSRWQAS